MKDYFPHDYNASMDEKILQLRDEFNNAEGYGMYWLLLEAMVATPEGRLMATPMATLIGRLSLAWGISKRKISKFLEISEKIGLIQRQDDFIFSPRLHLHKTYRKALSDAGLKGASSRWKNHGHPNSHPNSHPNGLANAKEKKVNILSKDNGLIETQPTRKNRSAEEVIKKLEAR